MKFLVKNVSTLIWIAAGIFVFYSFFLAGHMYGRWGTLSTALIFAPFVSLYFVSKYGRKKH